jgi:hypothetical protein
LQSVCRAFAERLQKIKSLNAHIHTQMKQEEGGYLE